MKLLVCNLVCLSHFVVVFNVNLVCLLHFICCSNVSFIHEIDLSFAFYDMVMFCMLGMLARSTVLLCFVDVCLCVVLWI